MPPKPVETRWCTWLKAVEYFDEPKHRDAVEVAMNDFIQNTKDKNLREQAREVIILH